MATYQSVAGHRGLYLNTENGNYYHRPTINSVRTWRTLATSSKAQAVKAMARLMTEQTAFELKQGISPYAKPSLKFVGEVLEKWKERDCPGANGKPRKGDHITGSLYRAKKLVSMMLPFWKTKPIESMRHKVFDEYVEHRRKTSKRLKTASCLEKEQYALFHAFKLAMQLELIPANPITWGRQCYEDKEQRVHCRELIFRSADELHEMARVFFKHPRSEVSGFQLLFECFTGVRTSEALACRWDAKPGEPGHIDGECLHLKRRKRGVNPYAIIHPDLAELLAAMKRWNERRFPGNPWFFPSSFNSREPQAQWRKSASPHMAPVNIGSLNNALRSKAHLVCEGHRPTSHSCRAFYVTVRRSEFIHDAQIAAEIGDKSGASIIESTYGALPPNWKSSKAGKMTWLPLKSQPAWQIMDNIIRLETGDGSELLQAESA